MDQSLFQDMLAGRLAVDLSGNGRWLLEGADAVRFLNGQCTNDIKNLADGHTCRAAVCDAKGKLQADVRVARHAESLWLDADAALRDVVPSRLDRYLIADEVEIRDLATTWKLFHYLGENPPSCPTTAHCFLSTRYRLPGWDLWLPDGEPTPDTAPQDLVRRLEFENAIAVWGCELQEGLLPPEARFDEDSHISYRKGCYIGQEVMSRIKSIGRVNRLLCLLQSSGTVEVEPCPLHDDNDTETGRLTRSIALPEDRLLAMGYLRRPHCEPGAEVIGGGHRWCVQPWPTQNKDRSAYQKQTSSRLGSGPF